MAHRKLMTAAAALVFCGWQAQSAYAQAAQPKTFSSPSEAAHALARAVEAHDERALEGILGAGGDVTSSGDESLDKLEREQFARKYQEMHRLVREPDGATVLYIGAENWPFPIPLTATKGRWSFDAAAGAEEVLYRRIGENETNASEACRAAHNTREPGEPRFGYRFRAVSAHGTTAPAAAVGTTGARPAKGKAITGITLVAYPTEYRSSGVVTFIVTEDGRVYEKDLGPDTDALAGKIDGRVPAAGWSAVDATSNR